MPDGYATINCRSHPRGTLSGPVVRAVTAEGILRR